MANDSHSEYLCLLLVVHSLTPNRGFVSFFFSLFLFIHFSLSLSLSLCAFVMSSRLRCRETNRRMDGWMDRYQEHRRHSNYIVIITVSLFVSSLLWLVWISPDITYIRHERRLWLLIYQILYGTAALSNPAFLSHVFIESHRIWWFTRKKKIIRNGSQCSAYFDGVGRRLLREGNFVSG